MRVVFMGTPSFAVPPLAALAAVGHELVAVVAQPDRPAGRGHALKEPATKAWAREKGVPVLQPEKVRDGHLAAELAALRPEVLCVAAYGRILGRDLLELARYGAVNVHGSLLPKYRGAAPIQWAIASGERETGVTIMQMDEGLDTGDVLLQRVLPIEPDDTAETLAPRLAALGGEALVAALALLAKGALAPVKQDPAKATLAPILTREDGRIDWTRPARELESRLRGFSPWPGAWTTLQGKVLKVLEASAAPAPAGGEAPPSQEPWRPGAAFALDDRAIAVPCAGGTLLLVRRLQLEGKAPQAAAAFMNGLRRKQVVFGT
jgi:methionyl-tRNA formyltransferase